MALQTTTQIFISGTPIQSYVSLKLGQAIDDHHTLQLICRADVVEQFSEELIGDSKEYLGGVIAVKISSVTDFGGYKELEFKGIVTKVMATKGFHQSSGDLVTIEAKSASILSDDGIHYASFNDVSLSDILDQTFQGYDKGKLETSFSPVSSNTIHYSVQHNQSAFSYASRLAAYYNEWFYYDGQKLVFGTPSNEETELQYGVDLQNFSVELNTVSNSFDYFTNDYIADETHRKSSAEISIPSEGYHGFMDNKSKELFNKQTQVFHNTYDDASTKARLDTQVDQYTKARAMQQVIAKGSSDNPGVNLGEIITVKGKGSYRIIKITHTNIEGGSYKNTFEAVDANFTAYPKMDINKYPISNVQTAIVKENNDPDGMGRIKVQFPWQKASGSTTPWLRMMTPHAGSDKGFHFIPELEEQVIVSFDGGNAEKPFVMGALYNGSAQPSSWQSDSNNIKAIKTRAGHTIKLDDTQGAEMITITDKNQNIIQIDTVGESILISAPENISIAAKNIDISASESLTMAASENMSVSAGEEYSLSSQNIIQQAEEDISIESRSIEANAERVRVDSTDENLELASGKQVDVQSNEKVKLF
ncbi:type VI secretion system Vgr family protein [Aquimarina latercula]|uniref:type VI secretion system Vgr family protein n=1 Tax=Aquimarina latercula TaxID=987 RepID=UPI000404CB67|nr:phage baseplate assembly protein V [Aquimarina latercula]